MIPLSFSLAFRNLKKNKRNTFSIAIGLFITITLLSAINFNLNLSRNDIIRQSSGIDFTIHGTTSSTSSNITNFLHDNVTWQKIASEPEISSVTPYSEGTRSFYNQSNSMFYTYDIYGVEQSYITNLTKSGKLTLSFGTLNITKSDFGNNSIPVIGIRSKNENISYGSYFYFLNSSNVLVRLKVVGWVTLDPTNTIFSSMGVTYSSSYDQYIDFFTYFNLVTNQIADQGHLLITVKPQYINLDNLDQTSTFYQNLIQRLNVKYTNYTFSSNVPLAVLIADVVIGFFQLIVIVFLVPFIFISLYISHLASQLNLESRRIQYGLFLSRGGKGSTLRWSYRFEGVLLGILTGIISYIITPVTGYLLHTWLPSTTLNSSLPATIMDFYSTQYILLFWLIVIGVLIGFFIMYIPSYYAYLNPKELLEMHRVEESDPRVRGSRDIFLLGVGLSPFAVAILIMVLNDLHAPLLITILVLSISSIVLYVVPFSPFLITYGMSAYLSRQPFLLKMVTNFYSKAVPDLKEILEKTILSKINSLTRIAFVIALAFTFIIVPLVASASLQNYNTKTEAFQIGSDMAVSNYDPTHFNESSLHGLSEIKSTTTILEQTYASGTMVLFYLNATSYSNTVNFQSYWNLTAKSLTSLNKNSILVTNTLLKNYAVKVGDNFLINGVSYKIVGIFGGVGGTDGFTSNIPMVIFNQQPSNDSYSIPRILIKFNDPNNIADVNNTISYIKSLDANANVMTLIKTSLATSQFDFLKFVLNIIDVQAFLLGFLSLGSLAFLMVIRIKERSRELGNWRSRGLDKSQLRKLVTLELLILSTFGFIIGIVCGGIITFILQYVFSNVLISPFSIIPYDFILPLNILYIIVIYIIGTFILSLILNYWTLHMKIVKQLRYEEYMR